MDELIEFTLQDSGLRGLRLAMQSNDQPPLLKSVSVALCLQFVQLPLKECVYGWWLGGGEKVHDGLLHKVIFTFYCSQKWPRIYTTSCQTTLRLSVG